jgi:phage shock protein A
MVNPESAKVQRELAEAVERSDRLEKELVECQEQIKALNEKAAVPAGTGHPNGFSSTEVTQLANAMLDMKLALEAEYSAKLDDEMARLKAGGTPRGGESTSSDSGETQAKNA